MRQLSPHSKPHPIDHLLRGRNGHLGRLLDQLSDVWGFL